MCRSMEELRDKSFAEGKAEGKAEGIAEGKAEGRLESYADLIKKKLINVSTVASSIGMTEEEFLAKLAEAGYSLS